MSSYIIVLFRFLLWDLLAHENSLEVVDKHWRPQWTMCPYCSLNFVVYAKMETLTEDVDYFTSLANISSRILVNDLCPNSLSSTLQLTPYSKGIMVWYSCCAFSDTIGLLSSYCLSLLTFYVVYHVTFYSRNSFKK